MLLLLVDELLFVNLLIAELPQNCYATTHRRGHLLCRFEEAAF